MRRLPLKALWLFGTLATLLGAGGVHAQLPPPFLLQWGAPGSGDGQFTTPFFFAFDDSNQVYVTDSGNARVQKFAADGTYLMQWNTSVGGSPRGIAFEPISKTFFVANFARDSVIQYSRNGTRMSIAFGGSGSANGRFSGPSGVAVVGGNLYVTDVNNDRVQRFSTTTGAWVSNFNPPLGTINGPVGIAADTLGQLLVANTLLNNLLQFNSVGTLLATWPSFSGPPPTNISRPTGICVDRSNLVHVVIADTQVVVLSPQAAGNPVLVSRWGASAAGTLILAKGIGVDVEGNVYVADSGNNRMLKFAGSETDLTTASTSLVFSQSVSLQATVRPATATGTVGLSGLPGAGILVGGTVTINTIALQLGSVSTYAQYAGDANVGGSRSRRINFFVSAAPTYTVLTVSPNPAAPTQPVVLEAIVRSSPPATATPNGTVQFRINGVNHQAPVTLSGGVATLVVAPEALPNPSTLQATYQPSTVPATQFLSSSATAGHSELQTRQAFEDLKSWGTAGSGVGQFNTPAGIANDATGNVYVADAGNTRIQKFTREGAFLTSWGSFGAQIGGFQQPSGIAVDASGSVYVADEVSDRIQKFTSNGVYVTGWGSQGSATGQFLAPRGVATSPSGNVYVVDSGNDRVQEFTNAGVYVRTWGVSGTTPGRLESPTGIAVDAEGFVYVGDTGNNRIQRFTSEGTYVSQWVMPYGTPGYLACDAVGHVYAIETAFKYVQQFTSDGRWVSLWGTSGTSSGDLLDPTGVTIDSRGFVEVVDAGHSRISKFTPAPVLWTVIDVPGDQGGQVRVRIFASPMDVDPSPNPVQRYELFREIASSPDRLTTNGDRARVPIPTPDGVTVAGWDYVGMVTAFTEREYELVVPTLLDSTGASPDRTTFFVRAVTASPAVFYDSNEKTGASTDDLPPLAPAAFTGQPVTAANALHWNLSPESDFAFYRLYRGGSADFLPSLATRIAEQPDTGYTDPASAGTAWHYKLSAVDVHGNEGGFALVQVTQQAVAVPAASPWSRGLTVALLALLGAGALAMRRAAKDPVPPLA